MAIQTNARQLRSILIIVAVFLFVLLTVGSSLTHRPQIDEGFFANPALNLANKGFFGTTIFDMDDTALTRIDQHTYWVMPLFLLNAAASFKIFGFSLFSLRLVSIAWGLIALSAWYSIVFKLSGDRTAAAIALILMAGDYVILDNSASGRMDMMSASLGFAALAAYLLLRERNSVTAVFVSQTLVVASGLTHPNGLMPFFGLIFLTLYFDFRRLTWRHVAAAIAPYLIGGAIFGVYVLQDVPAFRAQFIDNATMGGRMRAFDSPFAAFTREFTERYPHAFGLGATSGGHSGPIYLKSLILIGYVLGLLGVTFTKSLRQNRNYRALLILTAIYFVVMSLIDGQKEVPYLIQIVPFYNALLAIWLLDLWRKQTVPRFFIIIAAASLLLLQTGGLAARIRQNTYANVYQPTVDFLKQTAAESDIINAGAELGFGLQFAPNLVSDPRLGYNTGKRPKFIVMNDGERHALDEAKKTSPELYDHAARLLQQDYELVYHNAAYDVYARR